MWCHYRLQSHSIQSHDLACFPRFFSILMSCWRYCLHAPSASTPSKATLFGVSRSFGWSLYLASTWDAAVFCAGGLLCSHISCFGGQSPSGLLQWCKQLKLEWTFKVPLYRVTKADVVVSLARFPGEGPFFPQTTASGQQSPEDSSWLVASCESRVQHAQNPRSLRILFRGG